MRRSSGSVRAGLVGPYPYVWLDATVVKVREQGCVVSQAVLLAKLTEEEALTETPALAAIR